MSLGADEKGILQDLASAAVEPSKIVATCAYGSKVAGYAQPDSDYDLIVVAKKFRDGVRYRYTKSPVASSALIVDSELLERDAVSSYLGEFVIGRLLNVYEPLANPEFFRTVETEYKKRVILEALLELSSDYGEFASQFELPYDYFLFDKLKKRSTLYPPALYSYAKTYGGPRKEENLRAAIEGFRRAGGEFAQRGLVEEFPDAVRLVPAKLRGDAFTKVQSMFSLTTRGVTQYAVHGYAGRVGLSVITKEAQSKFKRMRGDIPQIPELSDPRSLLRLQEGKVVAEASKLEKEVAKLLGFREYTASEKDIGDAYSTTKVLTFKEAGREGSVVVKNFSDVRSLKWAILGVWAGAANKFSMSPLARLDREYRMTLRLKSLGVYVPAILAVAPDERIMVKELVAGPTLATLIAGFLKGENEGLHEVEEYGRLIARVHGAGMALGDAKPSNVIASPRGLFLTDLEQSVPQGDMAWDVAEFLFFTSKLSIKDEGMRRVAEAFLAGYLAGGDRGVVGKASGTKYFRPFQPFLTPGMAKMLREQLAAYA